MLKKLIFCTLIILSQTLIAAHAEPVGDPNEVINEMETMTQLWNNGDINAFVQYYKHSDTTLYVSSKIIKGYDAIAAQYLKNYPDRESMGRLSTTDLEIQFPSRHLAVMTGKWELSSSDGKTNQGIFTLLWKKSLDGWKIIMDHTS